MAFAFKGELTGLDDVFRSFRGIKRNVRTRILRRAVSKAARLILKDAKARVATRTGLLKKSLGIKVKTYRQSGVVVAIIGPRTGFKRHVTLPDGTIEVENPTVIAHLVEKGRQAVFIKTAKILSNGTIFFGTKVAAVPARPFLRPAFDANKSAAENIIREEVRQGLQER